jgi:hypothetical protein
MIFYESVDRCAADNVERAAKQFDPLNGPAAWLGFQGGDFATVEIFATDYS